jgi:hypothetical protein
LISNGQIFTFLKFIKLKEGEVHKIRSEPSHTKSTVRSIVPTTNYETQGAEPLDLVTPVCRLPNSSTGRLSKPAFAPIKPARRSSYSTTTTTARQAGR